MRVIGAEAKVRTGVRGAEAKPAKVDVRGERRSGTAGAAVTIGALARAAGVGVETVRYYQRRGLLPLPPRAGGYRRYAPEAAARLRFIRHAQQLGFTLDEIAELLQLSDGTDRASVRRIAAARLAQLRRRIADMQAMAGVLAQLISACEHDAAAPCCPIIESIAAADAPTPAAARLR